MGLLIEKITDTPTVDITVLVQFQGANGTTTQGDFVGTFKRLSQERIDEMLDPEENYRNSEIVEEVLLAVRGIGNKDGELPPEEQLAWVKKTPECVSASVAAFFKVLRPARYDEKTSKRRRSRG